jgi:hypothetical protein
VGFVLFICQIICLSRFKSFMLWCTLRCPRKNDVRFVFITICFVWSSCFIDIFVFIYVYWCPIRFLFQMMLVSFNGNTTDDTRGAGTANPSGSPVFVHPRFLWGSCWSIFSFLWSVFLIFLSLICCPLYCLSVFDLRVMITPNFSYIIIYSRCHWYLIAME